MRKRFLAAILAASMTASLFGCNSISLSELLNGENVEEEAEEETKVLKEASDDVEDEPEITETGTNEEVVIIIEEVETEPELEPVYEKVVYTVEIAVVNENGTYSAYDSTSAYLITLTENIPEEAKGLFIEGAVLAVTTLEEVAVDTTAEAQEGTEGVDTEETAEFNYDTMIELAVADAAVVEETEASILSLKIFENLNGYTITDMDETTMYASRSVNVRSGPSADTDKLGTLSSAQEVTVTGLTSTNWYRILYNDSVAYVSANYLADEKPATTANTTVAENNDENSSGNADTSSNPSASADNGDSSSNSTSNSIESYLDNYETVLAYHEETFSWMEEYLIYSIEEMTNAYMAAWGTSWDSAEWETYDNMVAANIDNMFAAFSSSGTDNSSNTVTFSSGYSTECVGYINELRASVGVSALTWSDSLAEVALARAEELEAAGALDGHAGLSKYGNYGENIYWSSASSASAYDAYSAWYNSQGHYENMVRSSYTYVAVAYASSSAGSFWVTIFQ